jgi:hypothetical protein
MSLELSDFIKKSAEKKSGNTKNSTNEEYNAIDLEEEGLILYY